MTRHYEDSWKYFQKHLENKECVDIGIWMGHDNKRAYEDFNLKTTWGIEPHKQLRALCKKLFDIEDENIVNLEIPTGNPLLINLNKSCKIISASYLDQSRAENLPKIEL